MTTIYAVSSGQPPAAIAVLRISGPDAFAAAEALCGPLPAARRATLRRLVDPEHGDLLDRALVLAFPAEASATGEDVVELHLHGGRAVVRAVEAVLARLPGLVAAGPGDFTRRALENGRLDLTEAEGLGDLLMAETEAQRRAALRRADGAVRRQVEGWTQAVLMLAARVEAMLDHADEEDVEVDDVALREDCAALGRELAASVAAPPVERLRDGLRVVLAGPPNAGKSTLINALADRDVAIVSPIAGTTRDRVEAGVTRAGIAWVLTDTAGLTHTSDDPIERIGVERALQAIAAADLVLWLGGDVLPVHPRLIRVHAKADLAGECCDTEGGLRVSARTGEGLDALWRAMEQEASQLLPTVDSLALNRRERSLLSDVATQLTSAARQHDLVMAAEELRAARVGLDRITGRADVEGVLDALFGRFCIGK